MKFILIALICLLSSCSAILPEFLLPIEEVSEEVEIVLEKSSREVHRLRRPVQP